MDQDDWMKDAFEESDTSNKMKPIIFSGQTYLGHVEKTFVLCQACVLSRNFMQWCVLLRDIHTKIAWFIDAKKMEFELPDKTKIPLNNQIKNELTIVLNRLNSDKSKNLDVYFITTLFNIQEELMTASQELHMGMGEKAENEFERDQEDGG